MEQCCIWELQVIWVGIDCNRGFFAWRATCVQMLTKHYSQESVFLRGLQKSEFSHCKKIGPSKSLYWPSSPSHNKWRVATAAGVRHGLFKAKFPLCSLCNIFTANCRGGVRQKGKFFWPALTSKDRLRWRRFCVWPAASYIYLNKNNRISCLKIWINIFL